MTKTKGMGLLANAEYQKGEPISSSDDNETERDKRTRRFVERLKEQNADFVSYLEGQVVDAKAWLEREGWIEGRFKKCKDGSFRWIGDLPPRVGDRTASEVFAFIEEAEQAIGLMNRLPKEIPAIRATFGAGLSWGAVFAYDQVGKKPLRESGNFLDKLARELERRKASGEKRPPRESWKSIVDEFRRTDGLEPMKGETFRRALADAKKRPGNSILRQA